MVQLAPLVLQTLLLERYLLVVQLVLPGELLLQLSKAKSPLSKVKKIERPGG